MRKNIIFIIYALLVLPMTACFEEEAPTAPACTKWTLELNNPEASVKIEDGLLVVDIPNPKTGKDVRLIQRQDASAAIPEVGVGIDLQSFEVQASEPGAFASGEITASFAYQSSPEMSFIGKSRVSGGGYRGISNGQQVYFNTTGAFLFYAEGQKALFDRNQEPNPVEIPTISSAAKNMYLDFGIDERTTARNLIANLHAEIALVAPGNYTNRNLVLVTGFNKIELGFAVDQFDCNSIQ